MTTKKLHVTSQLLKEMAKEQARIAKVYPYEFATAGYDKKTDTVFITNGIFIMAANVGFYVPKELKDQDKDLVHLDQKSLSEGHIRPATGTFPPLKPASAALHLKDGEPDPDYWKEFGVLDFSKPGKRSIAITLFLVNYRIPIDIKYLEKMPSAEWKVYAPREEGKMLRKGPLFYTEMCSDKIFFAIAPLGFPNFDPAEKPSWMKS